MGENDLQIVNPLAFAEWDDRVLSHQGHNFFHSACWAAVLMSYGYRPLYFTRSHAGQLATLVPVMEIRSPLTGKRGVALPFSDYAPPLTSSRGGLERSLDVVIDYGRNAGWRYLEIRGGELSGEKPASFSYRHLLRLAKTEDELMRSLGRNTRTNVKRAIRDKVQARVSDSLDSLRTFYGLYCKTRKRHGLPPQPFHFFQTIYEQVMARKRGIVVLALHEDKAVAGAVFFHIGRRALYKYGASDMRYKGLRPMNLVMWTAIQFYNRYPCESLCFGRTEPENAGLRNFKQSWGTDEEIIQYYRYDLTRDRFVDAPIGIYGLHNKIFSRMPVPLLKLTGALLYRHMA